MSMRWTGVQKIIALLVVTSYRRFPSAQHLAPRHGMVEMKRLKPLVQGSSILRDESLFDELFNLVNPEIQWNPSGTATWTFVGIKSPGSPLMLRDTFSRNCWYSQEPTGRRVHILVRISHQCRRIRKAFLLRDSWVHSNVYHDLFLVGFILIGPVFCGIQGWTSIGLNHHNICPTCDRSRYDMSSRFRFPKAQRDVLM